MYLNAKHLCWALKCHRSRLANLVVDLEYQPARRGRKGPAGAELYSVRDAFALTELSVMRLHGYPIDLLKHLVRVCYSTLAEETVIALLLNEPLPYPQGEELTAEAEEKGTRNTLYPPEVLRACRVATSRLAKLVRAKLGKEYQAT
jgi:hypothetical protein